MGHGEKLAGAGDRDRNLHVAGGLAAVIYTEVMQTVILMAGASDPDGHRAGRGRRLVRIARGRAARTTFT